MGRPKRVSFKKFGEYDKFHTTKTKMICGTEMTTLYPIKETKEFYQSVEVWAYCASKFRMKKKNVELKVDIPVITDEKTVELLNKRSWKDYIQRAITDKRTDVTESVEYLNRILPNHEKVYFYELDNLIGLYVQGTLVWLNDNGVQEKRSEEDNQQIEYYKNKYNISKTIDAENIFTEIGKNGVCFPAAFSDGTTKWAIEKYGKPLAYSEAGEIFFVVTKDKVFFTTKRHF